MPTPSNEEERRRELRKYRSIATGLLLIATSIYLVTLIAKAKEYNPTWIGYVNTAAEAGMVGGLADWFAVVALFKYPLGIKIPHTAIIRRKKDQVGEALSDFVGDNFFNSALVVSKVHDAHIPQRVAYWVLNEGGADTISEQSGKFLTNALNAADEDQIPELISSLVAKKLSEPLWGPPLGTLLQSLVEDGKLTPLVDAVVDWVDDAAHDSQQSIEDIVDRRAPSWAPKFVNNFMGEKVYQEIVRFTGAMRTDPSHPARIALLEYLEKLSKRLQDDPDTIAKVEQVKQSLMASPKVQALPEGIWNSSKESLIEMAQDPESSLRTWIAGWARAQAEAILNNPKKAVQAEEALEKAATFLVDNYATSITGIISDTIARWDGQEASDKIELMVGKDLQFIRVNGTVVGALAGLIIYFFSQIITSLVG